ncbi:MAG: diguanylate cyclase [Phormidesmis sp.]
MNSILLIGNNQFISNLRSQVRGLDALTVTTARSASEATALIDDHPPDVILIQASALVDQSVTKTFGQDQVAYTLVIECVRPSVASYYELTALQLENASLALESGADAHLWLPTDNGFSEENKTTQNPTSPHSSNNHFVEGQVESQIESQIKSQSDTSPVSSPSLFHPDQCRLIQAHLQVSLNRAQRYRNLSRINDWLSAVAMIDALTQISNRRAFDLELPNQIKMARIKAAPLSLMMLDIDYFKLINDRFGHLVGDDILRQLAKRLVANMRFYDAPFRFGGEEFSITLSNTGATEAAAIANRLRETIAGEPFQLAYPIDELAALSITVSIGMAELTADDDAKGISLIDRADKNLLRAKASGRNQVVATEIS